MGQEIQITAADGGRSAGYLALPSRAPAPGLVVLPEVFNTNAHISSVADSYVAEGFVVVAPAAGGTGSGHEICNQISCPSYVSL